MAVGRKATRVQSKIQMLIYGDAFTGKSTMAMQFCYMKNPDGSPFKVLYIDAENGSIDDYIGELEDNGVNLDNLYIVSTQSLAEVEGLIDKAKNKEDFHEYDEFGDETNEVILDGDGKPFRPDAIVVDGASILNMATKQGLIEYSQKRAKVRANQKELVGDAREVAIEGAGLELKDYNTISFKGQDFILNLTGCGLHYIVTAREASEQETKEVYVNGKLESQRVATGKKIPEGFKEMDYNAKTVLRMYRDDNEEYGTVKACVVKDRTGVYEAGTIIDDPKLSAWQTVVDKTKNFDNFVYNNNMSKSVSKEKELYRKQFVEKPEPVVQKSATNATAETRTKAETKVETTTEDELTGNTLKEMIKELDPEQKKQAKAALSKAGLPAVKFEAITDKKVLQQIANVLASAKA